jgi:hypothetical protein
MPSQNAYLVDQNKHQNNKQNKNQNKNQTNNSLIKSFQTDVLPFYFQLPDGPFNMIKEQVENGRRIDHLRKTRNFTFSFNSRCYDDLTDSLKQHLQLCPEFYDQRDVQLQERLPESYDQQFVQQGLRQLFDNHFKLVSTRDDDVNISPVEWAQVVLRINDIREKREQGIRTWMICLSDRNLGPPRTCQHNIILDLPFYTEDSVLARCQCRMDYTGFLNWMTIDGQNGTQLIQRTRR